LGAASQHHGWVPILPVLWSRNSICYFMYGINLHQITTAESWWNQCKCECFGSLSRPYLLLQSLKMWVTVTIV
jgi:hypothetical protein